MAGCNRRSDVRGNARCKSSIVLVLNLLLNQFVHVFLLVRVSLYLVVYEPHFTPGSSFWLLRWWFSFYIAL